MGGTVSYQHKSLAAGRWNSIPFLEQMAHIGGEVERALNWKKKGNQENGLLAYERALELCDLLLDDPKNRPRLKELARVRESLVDFFQGTNEYGSSDPLLRKYFAEFAYAARRNH